MGKYSEYDRATASAGWRIALYIIIAVVFFGGLTWGILAIRAATSETKGALDAQIQINKGSNQIASQERFENMYSKIKEYDLNLDVAAAALKRNPSNFTQTNYDGLLMQCNAAVAQYNAETRKISSSKWMSQDLPYEITASDPATDCKENTK